MLEPEFASYWGKTSDGAGPAYHPLAYHSLDAAACADALLLANPLHLRLIARALGTADADVARATAALLVALHDLGKFAASFQGLSEPLRSLLGRPACQGLYSRRRGTAHDSLGLWLWQRWDDEGVPLAARFGSALSVRLVGQSAFGHHGRPVSTDAVDLLDPGVVFPKADRAAALAFAGACGRLLLGGRPPAAPPDEASAKRLSFLVAGVANAADWLASGFPPRAPGLDLAAYWAEASAAARDAVAREGLASPGPPPRSGFSELYPGLRPSGLQAAADRIGLPAQFLFVAEDMPGTGKSEVGMTLASRAAASGAVRGAMLAMPTTATADAQADRAVSVHRLLFGDAAPASFSVAHSGRGAGAHSSDAASCSAWIADDRRRRLLAHFCVGTVDQALLAALPAKFSALRLLGLTGKILIVDEAHSFDGYTTALLAHCLRLHAFLGGSAVILSATLTAETKAALAGAFQEGAGFPPADPAHLRDPAFPLATLLGPGGSSVVRPEPAECAPPDKAVRLVHSVAEGEAALLDVARSGGCACWIRNTVDAALQGAASLRRAHGDVALVHSRFAASDRARVQGAVERRFGKAGDPAGRAGGIVVATSVIEQSLDLDFDLVVVDLKPMDLLMQALGRALRHRRDAAGRPLARGLPDGRPPRAMVVVSPDPGAVRGGGWYSDLLGTASFVHRDPAVLWRTARALRREGAVTYANCRALLEEAYDAGLGHPAAFADAVAAARAEDLARTSAARGLARGMSPETGYDHAAGIWDDARIPTRDGDSAEIVLVRMHGGTAVPYDGGDWRSGALSVRLSRVRRTEPPDPHDPALADAYAACRFSVVVPVIASGGALVHDGSVASRFAYDAGSGLVWSG